MEQMQIGRLQLTTRFRIFFGQVKRVISGEQPDAPNCLPEHYDFNHYQAYSILATSQSDLTISAGYVAFNAFFDLFNKGSSKFRNVLHSLLSFNLRRGEDLLPGAERYLRSIENSKYDAGSKTGEAGALSSFFYDPLLLVYLPCAWLLMCLLQGRCALIRQRYGPQTKRDFLVCYYGYEFF